MRTFGVMCVLIAGSLAQAAADGLVGHWDFNEGQGRVAQDKSGFGHHGRIEGATYADSPLGHALRFDGVDDFVDCAKHRRLAIESGGTVMLWYRLDTPQGGLVNWSTGDAWTDERLVVAFNTYSGGDLMIAVFADGEGNQMHALPPPPLDTWTHFALTFDGVSIKIYQDGVPIIVTSQNMRPKLKDVPFWIGKCQGLGKASVKGLLDEVRVYSHALPPVEVLTRYKEHAE
ncbi:MAG: LamG domain-containing protein, partial [Lentisphaeria bacterium]|nr:LamG domain-containing protein [Lentisphaeria bacterium]